MTETDAPRVSVQLQYAAPPADADPSKGGTVPDGIIEFGAWPIPVPDVGEVFSVGRLTTDSELERYPPARYQVVRREIYYGARTVSPSASRGASVTVTLWVGFLGWRRDLTAIYGATDVFLLTSRNEGTPVALIESLAAGVVGVSTDVGGVRDVVRPPGFDPVGFEALHVGDAVGDLEPVEGLELRRQPAGESGPVAPVGPVGPVGQAQDPERPPERVGLGLR